MSTGSPCQAPAVPRRRVRGPGPFDATGDRVAPHTTADRVDPAQPLRVDIRTFRRRAEIGRVAIAMRLANGVAPSGQGDRFLVVHRHAREGLAHVTRGLQRIGLAIDALRVHIDQPHHDCRQRVFQITFAGVAAVRVVGGREPRLFGSPVDILFRMPDIFTSEAEAEGLQPHRFVSQRAGENDQVRPAQLVAVLLLDRPQQTTGFVEIGIVRPGVERRESLIARAAAASPVGDAIGACRVPGHADHQAAVVPPVRRPPVLTVGHQGLEVFFERIDVERLDGVPIVKRRPHRVGLAVVLMQDVKVQRLGPPIHVGHLRRRGTAMHHRALARSTRAFAFHFSLHTLHEIR